MNRHARFERQIQITGWNQPRLNQATVIVIGRGWVGVYTVWALLMIGVGKIIWIGQPRATTEPIARWLLADPSPFEGCSLHEQASDPIYDVDLQWMLDSLGRDAEVLIEASESAAAADICERVCRQLPNLQLLHGSASNGGRVEPSPHAWQGSTLSNEPGSPVVALAVAGLLADEVRRHYSPLPEDLPLVGGSLEWETQAAIAGPLVVVGAGGIGFNAAQLLAAQGVNCLLVDHDSVDPTNRNRQSFSEDDARERLPKVIAATRMLHEWFPRTIVRPLVQRVDASFGKVLQRIRPRPRAMISAVDNAETRLVLQRLGQEWELPVIQAGTDLFSADCFTQPVAGPSLDDQMGGALHPAADRERRRTARGGCDITPAYSVPSLLAAAMAVHRCQQVSSGPSSVTPPPIRWRQGLLPQFTRSFEHERDLVEIA